ncbi:Holliday junction resolvase RecU [Alkalicoccobacillus plakortidis]|uniref:Holliday junction resolvase RecU n=1 Tax=Alkalicoccobacillus plakortidis TaxID=444060 RepID=A0ABT0XEA8_9BACI|nr:Holliday junction resolvase RecU [Alkalicoccobacillus plakortidis]MCM2674065.1 Holliday junction resolvase RecU [Alkalicoccobacillus plakortidis]
MTRVKHFKPNTGQAFENLLNIINLQYANQGIALINKRATPVTVQQVNGRKISKAYFAEKSTVDYDGTYRGKSIIFEAKSTLESRFTLKLLKDHQLEYLINAEKHGAVAFVLIEFSKVRKIFYCPVSFINLYYTKAKVGGHKSIPLADFDIYAYEVVRGRLSLDYLAIVDQLHERES